MESGLVRAVELFNENGSTKISRVKKMMGKKKFAEILGQYVTKPPGKLALVPESDPRPAVDLSAAADEFEALE